MKEPVSVIVRAYNAERYIEKALYSILKNTYDGLVEVVVCYDLGSKDHTLDIVRKVIAENEHRDNRVIKLIMHEHMTPFRALLNCGFANITGRFVSILDYDNLYSRRHIEKMVRKAIEAQKDFLFVRVYAFDDQALKIIGGTRVPKKPCDVASLIKAKKGNYIDANAMFIDRTCLSIIMDKLKKLNHRLYDIVHEDWLIALLALKYCNCLFNEDSYVFYRLHATNITANYKDYRTVILNDIRHIATLIAYYELERENLTKREVLALEYKIFERLIALSKILVRYIGEKL